MTWGSVRKLPSGRYQARAKIDGVYRPGPDTFDTEEQARRWLSTVRSQRCEALASGIKWDSPLRQAVTFGDYATRWVAGRSLTRKTRNEYLRALRELATVGAVDLAALDTAAFQGLSRGALSLARTIMRQAVADGLADQNPVPVPSRKRSLGGCSGRVYFLVRGDHIKIGHSVDVAERVRGFQHTLADVIGTIPGGKRTEAEWHRRFAHLRDRETYGGQEWFKATDELLEAIAAATETGAAA